jgi:hypothetical protein
MSGVGRSKDEAYYDKYLPDIRTIFREAAIRPASRILANLAEGRNLRKRAPTFGQPSAIRAGLNRELIILSDGAGQFKLHTMGHALCWVHELRHIKNLLPASDEERHQQGKALDEAWKLYALLKQHAMEPSKELYQRIVRTFDELFQQTPSFQALAKALAAIYQKRADLLIALDHPVVPLHNNASEGDIREFVKKRKVSGGTRGEDGQECRDTFASLKKTCRKLGVGFFAYLKDRLSGANQIERLSTLMIQAAKEKGWEWSGSQ